MRSSVEAAPARWLAETDARSATIRARPSSSRRIEGEFGGGRGHPCPTEKLQNSS
jgi:hypothetical protein